MGYNTINPDFYSFVDMWNQWYGGNVKTFHNYSVYNGEQEVKCVRSTLNMGKKVCEDWANMLMNERVKIHIDDETTEDFVNEVFADNGFWVMINEAQEYKSAVGTVAYVPYVADAEFNDGSVSGGKIKINFIGAGNIYPLSWENGRITECAFASGKIIENKPYVYLQLHTLNNGNYVIENMLFKVAEDGNFIPVEDMTLIAGLEKVLTALETQTDIRQFVIDRLNISNNLDNGAIAGGNPLGIPVFATAIDILKGIDLVYDSYNNEFLLGKKRVMVRAEATKFSDGKPIFDPNDLSYYRMPGDITDEPFIKEIDMTIRADEHETALETMLNLLSAKCGFGENHYQFNKGAVKTATEVVSENSTLFRTLKKHEILLEDVLTELVRVIIYLGKYILGKQLKEDATVTIDFDDSIIEDTAQIRAQAVMEFQNGLIDAVEYMVRVYNLTEDEAVAKVAKMEARRVLDPEPVTNYEFGI
ncbi:MAG: phage portal protein [Oscillospiraceae bacterium]|nr:phage portal protein [Oscillospiraceae bacterium]